jgi:hypothetical protein
MLPIAPAITPAAANPTKTPAMEPMSPASALSPRNRSAIWRRVAPSARKMPISLRRWVTAIENEL